MKKLLTMIAFLSGVLFLCACSSDDGGDGVTAFTKLIGTWRVDSIKQSSLSGVYATAHYPKGTFTITFNSDGKFVASGNAETYWYSYSGSRSNDGTYLLEDFLEWDTWSRNSRYDDNEVYIRSSNSVSGHTYGVTYSGNYQEADAVLWKEGSYPRYYLTRVK